jgi:DNA-binding response OmpR family regulator
MNSNIVRILIIDDDPQILDILGQILEREGHQVVAALNGKEGLKLYRENPTDLIITDLIMPDKEGIETIMELRRDFPDVKIIAISGGGHNHADQYLSMALKFGVQRTFAKPVARAELLKAVRELLN